MTVDFTETGLRFLTVALLAASCMGSQPTYVFGEGMPARAEHGEAGGDEAIAMDRAGSRYFYLCDGHGNVAALTDSTGAVVERYRYDAYGRVAFLTDAGAEKTVSCSDYGNPLLFQARNYDPESRLYNFRARYYSRSLGRFLSRDPNEYADATNLYQYCLQNPGNLSDPSGEILPAIVAAGLLGAAGAMLLYDYAMDWGRSPDFSYKEQATWGAAGAAAGVTGLGVGLGLGATALGTAAAGSGYAAWGATFAIGAITGSAESVAFQAAMDVGHGEVSGLGAYAQAAGIGAATGGPIGVGVRAGGVGLRGFAQVLRGRRSVVGTALVPRKGSLAELSKPYPKERAFVKEFFTDVGYDVTLSGKGRSGADILVSGGERWELKTLTTGNPSLVARRIKEGLAQADKVIVDLRRSPLSRVQAIQAYREAVRKGWIRLGQRVRIVARGGLDYTF